MAGRPVGKEIQNRDTFTQDQREAQQIEAWDMRVAGETMHTIAVKLGVHIATVKRRVDDEYKRRQDIGAAATAKHRATELERLDAMQRAIIAVLSHPQAAPEHVIAGVARLTKISERRSKLLGLDMPIQVEGSLQVVQVDSAQAELDELLNEAKARAANAEQTLTGRHDDVE